MFNFSSQLSLEDIKKIVHDCIDHLDPRDTWMITWIDKIFIVKNEIICFSACIHRVKSIDKLDFELSHLELNKPQVISLPMRYFRIFPVGTIFKNGNVLFKSHLSYLKSFTLDIDTSKYHEHLELETWKYGKEVIKTLCLNKIRLKYNYTFSANTPVRIFENKRSNHNDYDYIMFRDAELNRFYWFPSTRLMQALLNGASANKESNQLYVSGSANVKILNGEKIHEILLDDTMHLRDHPQIARLAFDKEALSSANRIYQSVLNSKLFTSNNSMLHLSGSFPFLDETSLQVKAFVVKITNYNILIVTEILQCHGPWPFERLRYDRKTPMGLLDDKLNPDGTKNNPIDKPEYSQIHEIDNEDEYELKFTYNRSPFLPYHGNFDNTKSNNPNLKNFQVVDKGSKFPTLTKDRERMNRTRFVPPRNTKDLPLIPTSNVSSNEKTQSGSNSTKLDVTSYEVSTELPLDSLDFLKKLCELFERENCNVDYILDHDENYFYEKIESQPIQINNTIIFAYFIRVKHPNKEFVICELDAKYGSSLKIITKVKESSNSKIETITSIDEKKLDEKLYFNNEDIKAIFEAYASNVKTLSGLPDNLKLTLLYHIKGCDVKQYKERIFKKVDL